MTTEVQHDNRGEEGQPQITIEWLTAETYEHYLAELADENAAVATTLRAWLDGHRPHSKIGIRWLKYAPARWHAHAFCWQCWVGSGEFYVGDDTIFPIEDRGGA